jgi:predicted nucleic acid-binding protein
MVSCFLDGSALAKRYVPETGSALVDFILENVAEHRIYILNIGFAEVVSVLVRKNNAGALSGGQFSQALLAFEQEVIQSLGKHLLAFDNCVAADALAFIVKHSINASDAILLRVAKGVRDHLRTEGDDLVLVAADLRLLRAAQAEGLSTFNPESQDHAALAALVGP